MDIPYGKLRQHLKLLRMHKGFRKSDTGTYYVTQQYNRTRSKKVIEYMAKRREIRNSTAEFLIFQIEGKEQGVEVYYPKSGIICTQIKRLA